MCMWPGPLRPPGPLHPPGPWKCPIAGKYVPLTSLLPCFVPLQEYPLFTTVNRIVRGHLHPKYVANYVEGATMALPTAVVAGQAPAGGRKRATFEIKY